MSIKNSGTSFVDDHGQVENRLNPGSSLCVGLLNDPVDDVQGVLLWLVPALREASNNSVFRASLANRKCDVYKVLHTSTQNPHPKLIDHK